MTLARPLTPLERAILQAIVELGEDAYGHTIWRKCAEIYGIDFNYGRLYVTLRRLEEEGFIRSFEGEVTAERGGRAKQYWRPVFDLTEVLKS